MNFRGRMMSQKESPVPDVPPSPPEPISAANFGGSPSLGRMLPLLLAGLAVVAAMTALDLKRFRVARSALSPPSAKAAPVPRLADMNGVESRNTAGGVAIALSERVLFQSGQADVEPRGRPVLRRVAEAVAGLPGKIRVEGHTDNQPIRHSSFSSNYDLSLARAHAVARFLVETGGLAAPRLTAIGFGAARPAAPNHTAAQRAANRRVEIVVLTEGMNSHG